MGIELKGTDRLIQKLAKISKIEAKKIINDVADNMEKAIVNRAKQFSDTEYMYIGKAEVRDYGNSCFIDVGLHSSVASFDDYKGLYFHNYGYNNWGWGGRFNGKNMSMHAMWFDEAVASAEMVSIEKIKRKVKAEFNAFNNS